MAASYPVEGLDQLLFGRPLSLREQVDRPSVSDEIIDGLSRVIPKRG